MFYNSLQKIVYHLKKTKTKLIDVCLKHKYCKQRTLYTLISVHLRQN